MEALHKVRQGFVTSLNYILIGLVYTLISVGFIQVILRKFANSSIPDADLVLTMLVYYIALFGACLATFRDKHITIEIVSNFVSKKANEILGLCSNIFAAVIVWILFGASREYIELQEGSIDMFMSLIPTHYVEAIIIPCFGLMFFGFVLNAAISVMALNKGEA